MVFCEALKKKERVPAGWKFILPSEAQWEYACRAGTTTNYSWGNEIKPKLANYNDSALKRTVEVGSYQPNPWGFFDMHGNVWEWCADWFDDYIRGSVTDPFGPKTGTRRLKRGGSWINDPSALCSSFRSSTLASNRNNFLGFRLCLTPSR